MPQVLKLKPLTKEAFAPFGDVISTREGDAFPINSVVAPGGANDRPDETGLQAFYVNGDQGVNYHAGVWHHPLLNLGPGGNFIVVDRIGSAPNCDECNLNQVYTLDGTFAEPAPV